MEKDFLIKDVSIMGGTFLLMILAIYVYARWMKNFQKKEIEELEKEYDDYKSQNTIESFKKGVCSFKKKTYSEGLKSKIGCSILVTIVTVFFKLVYYTNLGTNEKIKDIIIVSFTLLNVLVLLFFEILDKISENSSSKLNNKVKEIIADLEYQEYKLSLNGQQLSNQSSIIIPLNWTRQMYDISIRKENEKFWGNYLIVPPFPWDSFSQKKRPA